MKNHRQHYSLNYVEGLGRRFPRSTCGLCVRPCVWLGEVIRVDLAEGGFQVVLCLPCRQRSHLNADCGTKVRAA
jgi:hypothetical protein